MTPSEKQKEIAVAFADFWMRDGHRKFAESSYDAWLLTEEGKRLTAEEPELPEGSLQLLNKMSAYNTQVFDSVIALHEKLDHLERIMNRNTNER